jgi:hypothetical protein
MSNNGHRNAVWLKVKFVETSTETTAQQISRKSHGRSRVGNGAKLLPATDGRSMTARRFKDLVLDISADLGGKDILSEGERQLIRRAALLSAECERQEALAVRDERRPDGEIVWKPDAPFRFDIDRYLAITNALRRVLETVGLKRVSRDVTPDLRSYLQSKTGQP